MSSYYRVRIFQIPEALEEGLTQLAFRYQASGVSEVLQFIQPDLTYDPRVLPQRFRELDFFFLNPVDSHFFKEIGELNSSIKYQVFEEENKDWLEEWKKGFEPFRLVGPYWIVPSWLSAPPDCQCPISIDPGMAFGTGTHATTQMAAYFVYRMTQDYPEQIKDWSLLDVGTGTGILAMLARRGGFAEVAGVEIDPEARRVARDNIKLNGMEGEIEIPELQLEELRGRYDVIVANIIDGVLIKIKDHLLKVLSAEGHLFLTGILLERENLFLEQFVDAQNLQIQQRLEKDEWVGYWVQRQE